MLPARARGRSSSCRAGACPPTSGSLSSKPSRPPMPSTRSTRAVRANPMRRPPATPPIAAPPTCTSSCGSCRARPCSSPGRSPGRSRCNSRTASAPGVSPRWRWSTVRWAKARRARQRPGRLQAAAARRSFRGAARIRHRDLQAATAGGRDRAPGRGDAAHAARGKPRPAGVPAAARTLAQAGACLSQAAAVRVLAAVCAAGTPAQAGPPATVLAPFDDAGTRCSPTRRNGSTPNSPASSAPCRAERPPQVAPGDLRLKPGRLSARCR